MLRRPSLRRCGGADRCVPKSGSGEPEGQPTERQSPKRKAEEPTRRAEAPTRRVVTPKRCMPKAEVVSPKANSPRATPKRRMPKSRSREPEGQPAQRQSPKRCMPKSGSSEPEGQPAERQTPKRKAAEPTRRGQPRSVSPKPNPPSGNLRSGRQKNQLAEGNPEAVHAEKRKR